MLDIAQAMDTLINNIISMDNRQGISSLPDGRVQTYDYNPANAIWYILHTLSGLPESWLHTVDFNTVADRLSNEARGISVLFEDQNTALSYLQTINGHVDGLMRYGSDGKFHPKMIRNDYVVSSLPSVNENVFLEDPTFSRPSWIDTINAFDFNGDGKEDIAVANVNSYNVSILLGNGAGSFGGVTNFSVGGQPSSAAIGKS